VVQQLGEQEGFNVDVVRPATPGAVDDPDEVSAAIAAWQAGLADALKLKATIDWSDDLDSPYFTDKPAWDGYSALVLWAAHEEYPALPLPAIAPEEWSPHPAYQRAFGAGSKSRYSQLIAGPELWLPVAFPFTFQAQDPAGKNVDIGSVPQLVEQLNMLNARTWKASSNDIDNWRRGGADFGAPLETSARFAFAVFLYCAEAAASHVLTLKLDY
jgi:hypothetical protein